MTKKPLSYFVSTLLFAVTLLYAATVFSDPVAEVIPLRADDFSHIQFKKIKANIISFQGQQLQVEVDNSASILMLPFETVKQVRGVSFEWRSEGTPFIRDTEHESERSGDDAVFKLGLLLQAGDDFFNPFAASWLKQVKEKLHYPSEKMIYLVANAKHTPNEHWISPYNKRVTMISVAGQNDDSGWQRVSYQFENTQQVVALWLMADGDNTHASFNASIKNIVLHVDE
jgi:hypothetical protein